MCLMVQWKNPVTEGLKTWSLATKTSLRLILDGVTVQTVYPRMSVGAVTYEMLIILYTIGKKTMLP